VFGWQWAESRVRRPVGQEIEVATRVEAECAHLLRSGGLGTTSLAVVRRRRVSPDGGVVGSRNLGLSRFREEGVVRMMTVLVASSIFLAG
jgi:hypothetical protein